MKSNARLYLAALALFLCGTGYLLFTAISGNSTYFFEVSEALAMPEDKLHSVRLFGTVQADGLVRPEKGLGADFMLQDKNTPSQTIRVRYDKALPDAFKAGAEVIVTGSIRPDRHFAAHTLTTSCPSKYKKENRR